MKNLDRRIWTLGEFQLTVVFCWRFIEQTMPKRGDGSLIYIYVGNENNKPPASFFQVTFRSPTIEVSLPLKRSLKIPKKVTLKNLVVVLNTHDLCSLVFLVTIQLQGFRSFLWFFNFDGYLWWGTESESGTMSFSILKGQRSNWSLRIWWWEILHQLVVYRTTYSFLHSKGEFQP